MQTLVAWTARGGPGGTEFDVPSSVGRVERWYRPLWGVSTVIHDHCDNTAIGLHLWHDPSTSCAWPEWWTSPTPHAGTHTVASLHAPTGFDRVTGSTAIADAPGVLGSRLADRPRLIEEIGAPFVLVQVLRDELHLHTDVLGLGRLFEVARDDVVVWSNRPVAALLFAGIAASPCGNGWRFQAAVDWCMSNTSPFDGVVFVGPSTHIVARAGMQSSATSPLLDAFEADHIADPLSPAELERAAAALVSTARSVATLWPSQTPQLALSGGRDSRLVAAAFLAAGVRCTLRTNAAIAGEGETATRLVLALPAHLRPRHDVTVPEILHDARPALKPPAALARADRWHDIAEGLRSPVYLATSPPTYLSDPARPEIGGAGGEIAHGQYYPDDLDRVEALPSQRRQSEYVAILESRVVLPHGLVPQTRAAATMQIRQVLEEARRHGVDDARALDWFYLSERLRRWGTTAERAWSVAPLLTPDFLRSAMAMTPRQRATSALHRALISVLVPEWSEVDFFKATLATRQRAVRRRIWEEPDLDLVTGLLLGRGEWSKCLDADTVVQAWERATRSGGAGERDELLLTRAVWRETFEDHCRRVNDLPERPRHPIAVDASRRRRDHLAPLRNLATRLNDVGMARRFARTRAGRALRRMLGV